MPDYLNTFFFGVYPYIALAVMILGSIIRYDREPYSWRSQSSQFLRKRQLMWGSNLFHIGIIFLFFGHFIGLLTPHAVYEHVISAENKQMLAIVAGSRSHAREHHAGRSGRIAPGGQDPDAHPALHHRGHVDRATRRR